MTYLQYCPVCRGEGFRTLPPYDPTRPEKPYRWRSKDPCDECGGSGYRPATAAEIEAHHAAARTGVAA